MHLELLFKIEFNCRTTNSSIPGNLGAEYNGNMHRYKFYDFRKFLFLSDLIKFISYFRETNYMCLTQRSVYSCMHIVLRTMC